jgi:NAD(P)-dependent dehydrogenase (short-subunit alcohol dehydrogenase family)
MNNNHWTANDIPDLHGKIAVVTGANSGLGFYTSRALSAKGVTVIMACRNLEKGQAAADAIHRDYPDVSLEVMALDLADLSSVRAFAYALAEQYARLDLLVNNAGVMAIPYRKTADGFEMQFGTNHLGHFALTGLLLDMLLAAGSSRVVTVSSSVHTTGRINFEDINSEKGYEKWRAYSQSKLANLLFAYELQRRLEKAGCKMISVSAHPGYAATNLQFVGPDLERNSLQAGLMKLGNSLIAQSAEMGALPSLYAATAEDVLGCDYIGPGSMLGLRGYPVKVRSSAASYDAQAAQRLWSLSEQFTYVSYHTLEAPVQA